MTIKNLYNPATSKYDASVSEKDFFELFPTIDEIFSVFNGKNICKNEYFSIKFSGLDEENKKIFFHIENETETIKVETSMDIEEFIQYGYECIEQEDNFIDIMQTNLFKNIIEKIIKEIQKSNDDFTFIVYNSGGSNTINGAYGKIFSCNKLIGAFTNINYNTENIFLKNISLHDSIQEYKDLSLELYINNNKLILSECDFDVIEQDFLKETCVIKLNKTFSECKNIKISDQDHDDYLLKLSKNTIVFNKEKYKEKYKEEKEVVTNESAFLNEFSMIL